MLWRVWWSKMGQWSCWAICGNFVSQEPLDSQRMSHDRHTVHYEHVRIRPQERKTFIVEHQSIIWVLASTSGCTCFLAILFITRGLLALCTKNIWKALYIIQRHQPEILELHSYLIENQIEILALNEAYLKPEHNFTFQVMTNTKMTDL